MVHTYQRLREVFQICLFNCFHLSFPSPSSYLCSFCIKIHIQLYQSVGSHLKHDLCHVLCSIVKLYFSKNFIIWLNKYDYAYVLHFAQKCLFVKNFPAFFNRCLWSVLLKVSSGWPFEHTRERRWGRTLSINYQVSYPEPSLL